MIALTAYPSVPQRVDRTLRNTVVALTALVMLLGVGIGGSVIQVSCSKTLVITCSTNPFTGQPYNTCIYSFKGTSYGVSNGETVVVEGHQNLWDKLFSGTCSEENIYRA